MSLASQVLGYGLATVGCVTVVVGCRQLLLRRRIAHYDRQLEPHEGASPRVLICWLIGIVVGLYIGAS